MRTRKINNFFKAVVAISIALAFIMPVSASFTNFRNNYTQNVIDNVADNVMEDAIADGREMQKTFNYQPSPKREIEPMMEEETNAERRVDKVFIEVTEDVSPEPEVPQDVYTVYREGNEGESEPYVPPTDLFGDVDLVGERTQVISTGITIYVDDDNTAGPWGGTQQYPYQYIWQGIENATDGDIVYVLNGTYYENVVVDKAIHLIGESKENTIIDAQNYGTVAVISGDNVIMKNFQLKDGGEEWAPNREAGVQILGDYVTFENCELYDNYYCIYVISWYSTIINCTTHNNIFGLFLWYDGSKYCRYNEIVNFLSHDDSEIGIYSSNARNNTHINCVSENSGGIYAYYGTGNTYINCHSINSSIATTANPSYNTFINCSSSHASYPTSSGFWLHQSTYSTFVNVTVNGAYGTTVYSGIGMDVSYGSSDNTFTDCHFYDNSNDGLRLESGSNRNVFTNCEFYNNGGDGISNSFNGYDPASIENVFTNCEFYNNEGNSAYLWNGASTEFTGCTFADSHGGIILRESPNCVLSGNSINNNDINFDVQGEISDYYQNIGPTNTINGKYIYYLVSQVNKTLSNVGFLGLIDCTNISVSNSDMNGGIIIDSQQVELTNVDSHAGGNAFFCSNTDNITLTNCEFYDCDFGVQFLFSSEVTMRDTHIYNNTFNFKIDNDDVNDFRTYDMDESNTIQGKTIYYVFDISNMTVEEDIGFLGLITCHNVTVKEQNIPGAIIIDSTEIMLADTLIHDAAVGVYLYASSGTTITNCTVHNAAYGILLIDSDHNAITECTVYNDEYAANTYGIRGTGASHNNSISNCELVNYYITQRWQDQAADNTVTDTVIHGGFIGFYVRGAEAINNYWYNCEAYGNTYGFYISTYGSYATIENCSFHDNTVVSGTYRYIAGIRTGWDYNNTIINCEIYNNVVNGIKMVTGHDNKVINCNVYDNGAIGIHLECQNPIVLGYHSLTGNTVYNNTEGISLSGSVEKPVTMRDNIMYDNDNNFNGFYPNCDIDTSNTVNGKPIHYLYQQQDITLDETDNVGWVGLYECSNITVLNSEPEGAFVKDSFDCTFQNITRYGGIDGFSIEGSLNIDFIDCVASDAVSSSTSNNYANGFYFWYAPGCKVINCEMANNQKAGLYSYFSDGLEIRNCSIHDNQNEGIYFYHSTYLGAITNNSIFSNGNYGIYLKYNSYWNEIYHNNLVSNIPDNAYDKNSDPDPANTWDNGYPSGGNYWDDYDGVDFFQGPGQNISGSDGIGDTPYTNIEGGTNQDNYPLMNLTVDNIPPITIAELDGWVINDWFVTEVEVTLTATDHTGVSITYYKINDGSWNEYTAPFTVGDDGEHIVYFYSIDILGNTEIEKSVFFRIDQTPPAAPILLSPFGDIENRIPLFDWEDVSDISGISEYRLQVATDFNFVNIVIDETELTESHYQTISLLTIDETYYWKAQAVDGVEHVGDWSTIGVFTVVEDATMPTVPSLIEPVNNSAFVDPRPFFDWTDSYDEGGIDYYTLQIATDDQFTNVVFISEPDVSEYQLTEYEMLSSGQYYWRVHAVDLAENVGDWSEVWTFTILPDNDPPVTTHIFTGTMGDGGWYVSDVEVTLTAVDIGSGVDSTWYKLDDDDWQEYSGPFTVITEGIHTLLYYSIDNIGNVESTNSVDLKIDKTPPVTTASLDPLMPNGENGWYVSEVEMTLSATDAYSGVVSTWYKIDAGYWELYSAPFIVGDDGEHTVSFYSYDVAGNEETPDTVEFKIDQTPPSTTELLSGDVGENDWYISDVAVSFTATDETSGIDETLYRVDGGNWQIYANPFIVSDDGEHTLEYYSVDVAGNEENIKTKTFKIDQTDPTIELTWDEENSKLVADVDDETSGIAKVEFFVNGELVGEVTSPPYEFEYDASSGDLAYAIVYDNAGNSAESEEIESYGLSAVQSNPMLKAIPIVQQKNL